MSGAVLILVGLLLCLTGRVVRASGGAGSGVRALVAACGHVRRIDRYGAAHRRFGSAPRVPAEPGALEADALLRRRGRRRRGRRQAVRAARRQGRQRPARRDLHSCDRVPVRLPGATMEPQLPGVGHGVRRRRDCAHRTRATRAGPSRGAAGAGQHHRAAGVRRVLAGAGAAGQDNPGAAAAPGLGQLIL